MFKFPPAFNLASAIKNIVAFFDVIINYKRTCLGAYAYVDYNPFLTIEYDNVVNH